MLLAFGCLLYRRRYPVLLVWALVLLGAVITAPRVFQVLNPGGFSSSNLEAARAESVLAQRFGYDPSDVFVVYQDPSRTLSANDPAFLDDVDQSLADVRSAPDVALVTSPAANPRQIAPGGGAAYAVISLRTSPDDFREVLPRLQQALRPTNLSVTLTGAPVFYNDIYDVTESDLRRAELISLPFAALALFAVFGSLVAAAVPGIVGGASVAVTVAIMVLIASAANLSIFSLNLTTMLGLGLGIDYSLFIVSRFREELARTSSVELAIGRSVASAGRAVLFSGIAVFVGLLGLLLFDFDALRSLGIAGSVVVAVSVLSALTLLPPVLGVLGTRIDGLALPRMRPRGEKENPGAHAGFWARLATLVMAHPVATLIPVLLVLAGLGLPFLRVELGAPDASILPTTVQSRQGFDLLREEWGEGQIAPVLLVFTSSDGRGVFTPDHIGALYDFLSRVQADPNTLSVDSLVTLDPRITRSQYRVLYGSDDPSRLQDAYASAAALATTRGDTVVARVTSRYGQTDPRSKALVRSIRATQPPPGFNLLVGGGTAGVVDYADALYAQFPRFALLVISAIYLVLLITFRSVVLPLKAVAMNMLSILASFGALVVIFQEGALSTLLHFRPLGFVEASLPIVMFAVLFGLSMDYEVFLLSRVREAHDQGADNTTSVSTGLQQSGRIITSAAGIVVLVSLSFAAADIVLIKALGVGTAIAVFLDATIVRALLVPATMRLLGEWNWWAPRWVRQILPRGLLHAD